ncbi:hypothetical protein [Marinimicrobium agarilyticum]|uniref:hypothetical protein n=1 Tax=Marinimicrobium agarilyticum TaxID=306546 RepID=UPI000485A69B|nr:hypothetical protein [Marinimicrobium agarilyticum]
MALLVKKIAFISAIALGSVFLSILLAHYLVDDVTSQAALLRESPPLIIIDTFHGYFPGSLIIGVGIFLSSLSLFTFLYREAWYRKFIPVCSWIVLIGILALPAGGVGISYYWRHAAKNKEYVKCSLIDKISPAKIHTSYWVKEASLCNNKQVAKIISGTSLKDLKRANEYLENQKRLNNSPQ